MKTFVPCPKCLSAGQLMEPKETRGFKYKDCSLCGGNGSVSQELEDDYILSLNEDNFEEEF